MKVRVRCLCVEKLTLRIILRFKLVSVNCVRIYTLHPAEKPHFIIIHFTSIGRWMGGSCMGARVGGGRVLAAEVRICTSVCVCW